MKISKLMEELGEIQGLVGDVEVHVPWNLGRQFDDRDINEFEPIEEVECNTHTIYNKPLNLGDKEASTVVQIRVILR